MEHPLKRAGANICLSVRPMPLAQNGELQSYGYQGQQDTLCWKFNPQVSVAVWLPELPRRRTIYVVEISKTKRDGCVVTILYVNNKFYHLALS